MNDQQKTILDQLGIEISPEEQKVLDSLQNRLNDAVLNQKLQNTMGSQTYDPLEDPISPKHVTDYPRELRIMIDIEMSSFDKETGMLKEAVKVLQNWYHIPILENTDYTKKAGQFMEAFDKETNTLAHKIHFNEEQKSNQPKE